MKFRQLIAQLDIKARPFSFYMDDKTYLNKNFTGGAITLCLAMLLLVYSVSTIVVFSARTNYNLIETLKINDVPNTVSFGKKNNFVVAAGLSGSEKLYDPDIG